MPRKSLRASVAVAVLSLCLLAPSFSYAGDAVPAPEKAQDARKASADEAAEGCPYSEGGACCGSCQQKMHGEQAEKKPPGCPCQRARRLRQGS